MYKAILFGGTTEGRRLHELLKERRIPALTCVATEYGNELLGGEGHTGRMDAAEMTELFRHERPSLVLDATHPYAAQVSDNIKTACTAAGVEYLRVLRESEDIPDAFPSLDAIISALSAAGGGIFVTLGAKEAGAFTALPDYRERVWLRLLPSVEGLRACLELGYPSAHLICMQGPFSKELNMAMFRATGAKILVTKESGAEGGFLEKLEAAGELGMRVFVLGRPAETGGVSIQAAIERIVSL